MNSTAASRSATMFAPAFVFALLLWAPLMVAAQQTLIFADNFDNENAGDGQLNYASFSNWTVTRGAVDLIPIGGRFDFQPQNGLYVDLDGTTGLAGKIQSHLFSTNPNRLYTVQFKLAGSFRIDDGEQNNRVEVFFDGKSLGVLALPTFQPFVTFTFEGLEVFGPTSNLIFDHAGGDNVGLLLDDIRVYEVTDTGCQIDGPDLQLLWDQPYEFRLKVRDDGEIVSPVDPVLRDLAIISGPNTGHPIRRIPGGLEIMEQALGSEFAYTGNGETGDDTILAIVEVGGTLHECTHTVTWNDGTACYAGNGHEAKSSQMKGQRIGRQVLTIGPGGDEWTWQVCDVRTFTGTGEYVQARDPRFQTTSWEFRGLTADMGGEVKYELKTDWARLKLSSPGSAVDNGAFWFNDDELSCSCDN